MTNAPSRSGEDDLIARYFAPLATLAGADGLRDDAALVAPPPGSAFVVTADALVASIHFLADDPADTIARKALRVNLSDLAAKGATPFGFLLSLALPQDWTEAWLNEFAKGLAADVTAFGFPLIGGDTVKTPGPLMLSVTAFGTVPAGRDIPRRGGARVGDAIYVSGTIGDGALGLLARLGRLSDLAADDAAFLIDRYRVPKPRSALASAVLTHATASMDVSDGFVGDLTKLLRVSRLGATVELSSVPLSPAARRVIERDPSLFETALTGGDDYEVLCAIAPADVAAFEAMAARAGVAVTCVGRVTDTPGKPVFQMDGAARRFASGSFSHF